MLKLAENLTDIMDDKSLDGLFLTLDDMRQEAVRLSEVSGIDIDAGAVMAMCHSYLENGKNFFTVSIKRDS